MGFDKKKLRKWFTTKRNASRYNNRSVVIGNKRNVGKAPANADGDETQEVFIDNHIKTSKYTIYSFFFKNLFEQFRRIANFYFLIIGLVQLVIDSPVSPITSILPLIFVVSVTMLKQGYEDFRRHQADREVNDNLVTKIQDGIEVQIKSWKINVGNIICIKEGETFPCDMVLLSSSFPNGKASIMTANLDGETNLKVHNAPQVTRMHQTSRDVDKIEGVIECENPNADLNRFVGRMKISDPTVDPSREKVVGLGLENVVLRGTELKNTEFVYGCAVYTGLDTKMSRNSKLTSNKFSTVEKSMNKYLIFFLALLLVQTMLATVLKYQVSSDRPGDDCQSRLPWYLAEDCIQKSGKQIAQDALSFLVLFNYIIPISLYVTLECQKFFGTLFFIWDKDLYDLEMNQPGKCNSSDLNEELGQVEYLFSDKTGTLTQNVMEFKECSIDGKKFHDENKALYLDDQVLPREKKIRNFLVTLALCHTVQVAYPKGSRNPNQISYNASSPDEKAIVEACRNYGVTFLGEKEEREEQVTMKLLLSSKNRKDEKVKYERLHVLEFDSNRKCMSVIVRDPKGEIRMLTKGAESSVLPKCIAGPLDVTADHINSYALIGLRTLAIASKKISESEFEAFQGRYDEANQSLTDREKKIKLVYSDFESDLKLLGAIAVEDKLQEDVRQTLIKMEEAGIKTWILTGDKKETAINISFSCGHFQRDMKTIDLVGYNVNTITNALEAGIVEVRSHPQERWSLVVDGAAITAVFTYPEENISLFRTLADGCIAVICCRMSPLQKADIVKMIKNGPTFPKTAAIGDGANDVSMIQEAHVGLGITGKEGRAAVRAADFAFAKFKHLQKVLLVHGHW